MRLAALQTGPGDPDPAANLRAAGAALAAAAAAGARLAVLPELALLPYFCAEPPADWRSRACPAGEGPAREIAARCARLGIAALLPFFERDGDRFHNSAVMIGPDGTLLRGAGLRGEGIVARKLHLPRGDADETAHFAPGDDVRVYDLGALRVGVLICYDRRFPECWRALRGLGAEAVAVPVAGASGEDDAFVLGELRTHARENGLAVIHAAKSGSVRLASGLVDNPGGSCVIGADGAVLARCGTDAPALALADVAREDVRAARARLPLFEQCRRDLFVPQDTTQKTVTGDATR